MSNQGDGQPPGQSGDGSWGGEEPGAGQVPGSRRLPGTTGNQQQGPRQSGGQPQQGQWTGGEQPGPRQSGGQPQGQWAGNQQQGPGQSGGQQQGQWTGNQQQGPGQSGGQQQGQWTGNQQQGPGQSGGQQQGQWTGGQQPWSSGSGSWSTGGQDRPSWSTSETGPNVGATMNNPQSGYYDRFSQASGEGVVVPGKNGGGHRGKALIGLAAALVLVIAAVAVFALTRGDDSPKKAGGSSSTSSLPPVTATTWVNPTLAAGARALKPGWVAQTSQDIKGQYDVPKSPDWKVESTSSFRGYADAKGKVLAGASGTSVFGIGFCPGDKNGEIAWVGLRNIGSADPTDVGADSAARFADAITQPAKGKKKGKKGKVSDGKSVKVNQGTIPAVQYTDTATSGDPNKCEKGKTFEITTTNFSAQGKSYQLLFIRMLGGPKGVSTKQRNEIISTFRPGN